MSGIDDAQPEAPAARSMRVAELIDDEALGLPLELVAGEQGTDRLITGTRIQKSGLALAGHFYGIEPGRIQILGVTEMSYLADLAPEPEQLERAVRGFFSLELGCVIITEGSETMAAGAPARDRLIRAAADSQTPLLVTPERSSRTITALHHLLDDRLAPRQRVHAVLVDVFEVGLLLFGTSGVGKSEVALELIMRGHRLVADDVVECHYRPPGMVFGAPADLLRHHLEVRGLGILNVKDLFGVTAVRDRKRIDVVVRLVDSRAEEHDRLGLDERRHRLLGVDIPELLVPVRPGRDMATIMEIAARNELLKRAGHHPTRELLARLESNHGRRRPDPRLPESATPPSERGEPSSRGGMRPPPESSVGLPRKGRKR